MTGDEKRCFKIEKFKRERTAKLRIQVSSTLSIFLELIDE
jgi:hypothetical protein